MLHGHAHLEVCLRTELSRNIVAESADVPRAFADINRHKLRISLKANHVDNVAFCWKSYRSGRQIHGNLRRRLYLIGRSMRMLSCRTRRMAKFLCFHTEGRGNSLRNEGASTRSLKE